jgi:hypothetical protein
MRAATEASVLGVRRPRTLLSMIVGRVSKNLFLPDVSGIHCRADAGFVIQLIAADLRKRQISKNQEKKK